jgi:hypothetical protein
MRNPRLKTREQAGAKQHQRKQEREALFGLVNPGHGQQRRHADQHVDQHLAGRFSSRPAADHFLPR